MLNLFCPTTTPLVAPQNVKAYGKSGGKATVVFSSQLSIAGGWKYFRVVSTVSSSIVAETACNTKPL